MLDQLGCDYLMVNASLDRNIDMLRNTVAGFASSVSFKNQRKYVILDEADFLNHLVQPALRNFMQTYSKNCGFILTVNYPNKLIKELHSRTTYIDFKFPKDQRVGLAFEFFQKARHILDLEKIPFDKKVLGEVVLKFYPDFRKTLNALQTYSAKGKIDTGILTNLNDISIKELIDFIKDKDFDKMRQWAAENSQDVTTVFRNFYEYGREYFKTSYLPDLVILINDAQKAAAIVVDQEINVADFLVKVMKNGVFK
jgi:DNA polymerase III delta prime subunit